VQSANCWQRHDGSHLRRYLSWDPRITVVGSVDDDPAPGTAVLGPSRTCLNLSRTLTSTRSWWVSREHIRRRDLATPVTERSRRDLDRARYFELITWRSSVKEIAGLALIDVAPARLNLAARTVKRTFDMVVGSLLLLIALPGLVVVAISIKMSSPGPVLFRQERIGKDNKPFTIYKLRTMAHDAEQTRSQLERSNETDGPLFKIRADPRATPIGRFLEEDEPRRGTATIQRVAR